MDKMNMDDLIKQIEDCKPNVERRLIRSRSAERLIRTRERDPDEQKILDKLCIARWNKAEEEGKIKYISERKWYYEFD